MRTDQEPVPSFSMPQPGVERHLLLSLLDSCYEMGLAIHSVELSRVEEQARTVGPTATEYQATEQFMYVRLKVSNPNSSTITPMPDF
jgi:hypothetical protein